MKSRYILFRRAGVYYSEDTQTGKQASLRTKDESEALTLLNSKNEAVRQPAMNLQIAQVYLHHADPTLSVRTWQHVMEQIIASKTGNTRERWEYAIRDKAFDSIRQRPLLQTTSEQFLEVLNRGSVSTNVYLRRAHNYAIGMHWLPWPVLPPRLWPAVHYKAKRAITLEEHERIVGRERNPEIRAFYQLLWQLGGSQTDVATLTGEDVHWPDRTISYRRQKTGAPALLTFGSEAAAVLENLPKSGPLFPRLARLHEKHRAKMFVKRLATVAITGVSLHSYRYAWAERAKEAGYPERYAMQALGHSSKAVHRAYARKAQVVIPSLEDYERKLAAAETVIVPMPMAAVA
ncbi:MAG TPA: tyrosine-type recombinase/integrase [Verrucomicrobiae bacterium]|jgi:integrase